MILVKQLAPRYMKFECQHPHVKVSCTLDTSPEHADGKLLSLHPHYRPCPLNPTPYLKALKIVLGFMREALGLSLESHFEGPRALG